MLKKLPASEGNILEYEVDGKLTEQESQEATREVEQMIEQHGSIKILEYAVNMPKVDVSSMKEYFSFAKENMKHVDKYALVTDSHVAAAAVKASDAVTKANFRTFGTEDLEKARAWLRKAD